MSRRIATVVPTPRDLSLTHLLTKVLARFERDGDVLRLALPAPFRVYALRRPEHIRAVTVNRLTATVKPPHAIPKADALMGDGLFNDLGGPSWRLKRRELNPAFAEAQVAGLAAPLGAALATHAARWAARPAGTPVDLYRDVLRLVLDYSARALFSTELGAELDWVADETVFAETMFVTLSPLWWPLAANRRFRSVSRRFNALMQTVIDTRRRGGAAGEDALGVLLAGGGGDAHIRAAMFSVFFGASAMALPIVWSLYFLAHDPAALARLRAEIAGRPLAGAEDLRRLPYLDMVFREVLRIMPAFWGSLRYARAPLAIDGYDFPARSVFAMIRFAAQRHPDHWPDPGRFDPERFAPGRADPALRHAYLPYGLGPRMCIGRPLAALVCPLALGAIVRDFDLRLLSDAAVPPRFGFGVYPATPILAAVTARA